MVDYSGSNAIELEDDVFEEVNNFTPMPQYIPGLPEKPDLIDPTGLFLPWKYVLFCPEPSLIS